MKYTILLFTAISLGLMLASCGQSDPDTAQGSKIITGKLQKQGMTTYQYGTHVLLDEKGNTLYALKSGQIKLDTYVGKTVELEGNPIDGYPVDGGPEYIEVTMINLYSN